MRVELEFEGGMSTTGLFVHKTLPDSLGYTVAGFAASMLEGQTQPGVWFPEERDRNGQLSGCATQALAACVAG
jgi:hypothetical protein